MIKRVIGILGTLGVIAVIAFAILGRESYSSALTFEFKPRVTTPETEVKEEPLPANLPDSVVVEQATEQIPL